MKSRASSSEEEQGLIDLRPAAYILQHTRQAVEIHLEEPHCSVAWQSDHVVDMAEMTRAIQGLSGLNKVHLSGRLCFQSDPEGNFQTALLSLPKLSELEVIGADETRELQGLYSISGM
jgi:hypothetical protein